MYIAWRRIWAEGWPANGWSLITSFCLLQPQNYCFWNFWCEEKTWKLVDFGTHFVNFILILVVVETLLNFFLFVLRFALIVLFVLRFAKTFEHFSSTSTVMLFRRGESWLGQMAVQHFLFNTFSTSTSHTRGVANFVTRIIPHSIRRRKQSRRFLVSLRDLAMF